MGFSLCYNQLKLSKNKIKNFFKKLFTILKIGEIIYLFLLY